MPADFDQIYIHNFSVRQHSMATFLSQTEEEICLPTCFFQTKYPWRQLLYQGRKTPAPNHIITQLTYVFKVGNVTYVVVKDEIVKMIYKISKNKLIYVIVNYVYKGRRKFNVRSLYHGESKISTGMYNACTSNSKMSFSNLQNYSTYANNQIVFLGEGCRTPFADESTRDRRTQP